MNAKNYIIRPWQSNYSDKFNSTDLRLPPKIVYKYTTLKRAKEIIDNKKLWFSCPNDFNDPFDMYQGLIDFSVNKSRAKLFANSARADQSRSIRRAYAKDVLKRKDELIEHQKSLFEETKRESGVCCFSESPDIALMWSHYADSHKGVVLGFNIDPAYFGLGIQKTFKDLFFIVQHVHYMDKIEPLNFYDFKEKAIIHWILTKSSIWSYEKEIRAFFRHRQGLIDYDTNCLKEVHFGCNTTEVSINEIKEILPDNISLSKKLIDRKNFNITSSFLNR